MANKIKTALSMQEFSALLNLINEKENSFQAAMVDENATSPLKTVLLKSLDEDQREEFIRQEVKKVLSRATGKPVANIEDGDSLTDDLHMNSLFIRALAVPFTKIARQFNATAVITPDECEECEKVDDCVTLVVDKSKN